MENVIEYKGVTVSQQDATVLTDVTFEVKKGEFLYIIGKVGAGKSSLLKTLYGELDIRSGEAAVLGYNLRKLRRKDIPPLRRKLGIIFQDFQLLTDRSVHDNLRFVLRATGWKRSEDIELRIVEALGMVDMTDKADKLPAELSGGEQQRIVIARAMLNNPEIILADEPTGNLDAETGRHIVEILHEISKKGTAVIMSTHNLALLNEYPARVLQCQDGKLIETT